MTATNHERTVAVWLSDLGKLTAGAAPLSDAKAKIASMAAALAEEFPPSAFSRASLVFVARQCKFFPTFGEVCDALGPWWKQHRPTPLAIAADQDATIKQREIERAVRESWDGITAPQVRAKIRAVRDSPAPLVPTLGSFLAAALGKHAPHHLALLPPEWLKDQAEPPQVQALRKAAALTLTNEIKRSHDNDEDWRHL